jgi:hypothetical protein
LELTVVDDRREWISFEDPDEHRTWLFDVSFLTSNWSCIFGAGCPGIEPEPAPEKALGCCIHGAYLSDNEDREHVTSMIEELTDELWQYRRTSVDIGGALWQDDDGWWRTKVVDGACIFQNRPEHVGGDSHQGGAGCAFHHLAEATGRRHMDTKPEICWQAPLRREDHETVTGHIYTMVREWERRDWGGDDEEVSWWCTSDEQAHVSPNPVYRTMRGELEAICGAPVYALLEGELDARRQAGTLLPHPTVRR